MKVVSVNVGRPREIEWQGQTLRTAIFKAPAPGRVRVFTLNLEGDEQADLTVHGGVEKAVYAYPSEHYPFWAEELPGADLPWGAFGENLTTAGIVEASVRIGDRLRIGSAELRVTQPRMPCLKLAMRFGRLDIAKRFLGSGRTGFYMAVLGEGEVAAGDSMEILARDPDGVTVADVVALHTAEEPDQDMIRKVSELSALPRAMREHLRKRLT